PVRRQGVGCQPPLDREVVEVGAQREGKVGHDAPSGLRGLARAAQPAPARTSSRSTASMPVASPTGALVSVPSKVFRPSASEWSSRHACTQPLSASATAYGIVALVRAYVEVFGTAPGMFATQQNVELCTWYVGSECVVAWVSAKQPPWSTAMSTSTEPGFICATRSLEISLGAAAPGISTAPITMSASRTCCSIASLLDASPCTRLLYRQNDIRSLSRS